MDYESMSLRRAGKQLGERLGITSEMIDKAIKEVRQQEARREQEKKEFNELKDRLKAEGISEHDIEIILEEWLDM